MTINQARAEAAKRSQANKSKKAYILQDDVGNYTVTNAPLTGYVSKFENGNEVTNNEMKKKTQPAKPAAKVAAAPAKSKGKVSKATKQSIVAAIAAFQV
jgi:hypothetical protein